MEFKHPTVGDAFVSLLLNIRNYSRIYVRVKNSRRLRHPSDHNPIARVYGYEELCRNKSYSPAPREDRL